MTSNNTYCYNDVLMKSRVNFLYLIIYIQNQLPFLVKLLRPFNKIE